MQKAKFAFWQSGGNGFAGVLHGLAENELKRN
jgi:hypothetical protein